MSVRIHLISEIPPPYGGVAVWTKAFIGAAPAYGLDIDLVHGGERGEDFLSMKVRIFRSYRAHVRPALRILRGLAAEADVVHICSSGGLSFIRSLAIASVARQMRKPVVVHIHSSLKTCPRWALDWAARMARDKAVAFVSPCHEDAATYPFIRRVDNFISSGFSSHRRWKGDSLGKELKLVYMGWIIREKGLFELLEAVSRIENVTVDLYGPKVRPADAEKLETRARHLGVGERFRYRGTVQHEKVPDTMLNYDALVCPSYGEAFGLVAAEAMMIGMPVIASRVGFLWDAPEGVAACFEKVSSSSITNKLTELANDHESLKAVAEAGYEYSRAFTAERVVPIWLDIYTHLAGVNREPQESPRQSIALGRVG